jgi:hypothetical protein
MKKDPFLALIHEPLRKKKMMMMIRTRREMGVSQMHLQVYLMF